MSLMRCGALLAPSKLLPPVLVLAAATLSACASSTASTPRETARISASPRYAATENGGYAVELEDDGIPVQPPPLASRRPMSDDPSEPFSPNYGRADAPADRAQQGHVTRHSAEADPDAQYVPVFRADGRWQRARLDRSALAASQ